MHADARSATRVDRSQLECDVRARAHIRHDDCCTPNKSELCPDAIAVRERITERVCIAFASVVYSTGPVAQSVYAHVAKKN